MNRKLFLIFLTVLFVSATLAQSVGVAPAYISAGTIQRGDSEEVTLHLTSNSESAFNVRPSYKEPFTSERFSGAFSTPSRVSEQDISDWVKFSDDLYPVNPDNSTVEVLGEGTTISSNGKIEFKISVPRDAEPGYHSGRVRVSPLVDQGGGYGSSVVAQASSRFEFRVPGNVERDLRVQDVNAYRLRDKTVRIDTRIENTGTVTAQANSTRFLIENYVGEGVESISENSLELGPGESRWITSYWTGEDVEAGEYELKGTVNYVTGSSFASQSFSVGESINITAPDQETLNEDEDKEKLPSWLVIMFLVLVGVVMYSFEIDPMTILVFLGLIAAALLVTITELSNSMLLLVLTTSIIILYVWYR